MVSHIEIMMALWQRHPLARDMGTGVMVDGRWLSWTEAERAAYPNRFATAAYHNR